MARTTATVGIDVGTSGAKGVLVAEDGRVLARKTVGYPLATPRPGWTEQDPEAWWAAARDILRHLTGIVPEAEIAGVGLSGQMHGSVFLDRDEGVIRPALLWNDARTGEECTEIERRVGADRVIAITGNRASAGMQAPKILWLRRHEPEAYGRLARVLLPKDFLRLRLTGVAATDASDASGTLLLDLARRRYSQEIVAALEIPEAWLPQVHESAEVTGRVTAQAAAETGLAEGTPVVAGGGDNACAAIGAGIVALGQGAVSIGTSGTIFLRGEQPLLEPEGALNAFCDAAGGWHLMGVILNAGGALRWFADAVAGLEAEALRRAGLDPFAVLVDQALALPEGAEGLLFLPYLAGERSPHNDAQARGAWVGLSLAHDRRHMLRALLDGVGFAFADCLERMRALGLEPQGLQLVGGGARNAGWRRLLATQLRARLATPAAEEGPALGAAILARVGCGVDAGLAAAVARVVPRDAEVTEPDATQEAPLRELHARYQKLYPALRGAGLFG